MIYARMILLDLAFLSKLLRNVDIHFWDFYVTMWSYWGMYVVNKMYYIVEIRRK